MAVGWARYSNMGQKATNDCYLAIDTETFKCLPLEGGSNAAKIVKNGGINTMLAQFGIAVEGGASYTLSMEHKESPGYSANIYVCVRQYDVGMKDITGESYYFATGHHPRRGMEDLQQEIDRVAQRRLPGFAYFPERARRLLGEKREIDKKQIELKESAMKVIRPLILVFVLSSAMFGGDLPLAICPESDECPKLDGKLDDNCWKNATYITDLLDSRGNVFEKQRNEVFLCSDKKHIYIGVKCHDTDIDRIKKRHAHL